MQGQLILEMVTKTGVSKNLDCGIVSMLSDRVNVSISHTPIVTYTAENAFLFDTGATDQISITLLRRNPENAYDPIDEGLSDTHILQDTDWSDSHIWCNRLWKEALVMLINRWQVDTDGCLIHFTPVVQVPGGYMDSGDLYQRGIYGANAYLKSESITYDIKSHELISATIDLVIGSMCGDKKVVW